MRTRWTRLTLIWCFSIALNGWLYVLNVMFIFTCFRQFDFSHKKKTPNGNTIKQTNKKKCNSNSRGFFFFKCLMLKHLQNIHIVKICVTFEWKHTYFLPQKDPSDVKLHAHLLNNGSQPVSLTEITQNLCCVLQYIICFTPKHHRGNPVIPVDNEPSLL